MQAHNQGIAIKLKSDYELSTHEDIIVALRVLPSFY